MKIVIDKNKPPIADAGADQIINLPTDNVSLDARQSNDKLYKLEF